MGKVKSSSLGLLDSQLNKKKNKIKTEVNPMGIIGSRIDKKQTKLYVNNAKLVANQLVNNFSTLSLAQETVQLTPVTVSAISTPEELVEKAFKLNLTISQPINKHKKSKIPKVLVSKEVYPNFYSGHKPEPNENLNPEEAKIQAHISTLTNKKRKMDRYLEVEYIGGLKWMDGTRYYQIKWTNWPVRASTWEPVSNLHCDSHLVNFHKEFNKALFEHLSWCKIRYKKFRADLNKKSGGVLERQLAAIPKSFKFVCSYARLKKQQRKQLMLKQQEINSLTSGSPQVSIENEVDLDPFPQSFTFVNANIPVDIIIPEDPMIGCSCSGNCMKSHNCCPHQFHQAKMPYKKHDLIAIGAGKPIYECNKRCSCSATCPNRVVQNGSKYKLCIFKTISKGWGVKALEAIPLGAFVTEYVGEVCTNNEANNRGVNYKRDTDMTYLFNLDYDNQDDPNVIDATNFGNVSHFINHSCQPNLQVYNVFVDNLDPSVPRIALFARRAIEINEELTFDYQIQLQGGVDDSLNMSIEERKICHCGAKKCRGFYI